MGRLSPNLVKPQNVVCNIFSELTPKASLLFLPKEIYWNCYRKILRDNWKPNRTLSINFVLKLRFRENPLWNENLKPNFAWKFTLRDNPNFANKRCVEFYKFRKYYAAHNSGLKIWLVSGIFEMAQLFNLKFWLYLWRLGVGFRHIFKPQNVVYNIFSELTLNDSLLFFPKEIYWNCYRKILCENWKPNRTLSINFVLKIRFRKIRCEIKNWNQTLRENLLCVTIRTFRWVLFLSSENIILYTTAV